MKLNRKFYAKFLSLIHISYQIGADNNIPELTLKAASTPLHAGTVQYLTELGYEVPAELIPEEYVPVNP